MSAFKQIAAQPVFAIFGLVAMAYPAETPAIDDQVGLVVDLVSADTDLGEQSIGAALEDTLLVFAGSEVLSVFGSEFITERRVKLWCIRARKATRAKAHAQGEAVYIVPREGLKVITHPQFQVGNTVRLKVCPFTAADWDDPSRVDEVELPIAGEMFKALAPENMRFNGNGISPSYTDGQGGVIEWSLPELRSAFSKNTHLSFMTVVEFMDGDGAVLGSRTVGDSRLALAAADLVAILGGVAVDFTLRAATKTQNREWSVLSEAVELAVKKL